MLQWTHKHIPISVSICSNVEGYIDPVCIVNANQNQLVENMVTEMNAIALRVYKFAKEKWGWVLEAINEKVRQNEEEYIELDIRDIILQGVDTGTLFGMVEVDIEVLDQWPPYFQHPTTNHHVVEMWEC